MATNSSVNLVITNNADGFDIAGGTSRRKLTTTGADITLTGSGTNVYTFPASTSTLVSLSLAEALTNKSVNGVTLTTGGGTTNFLRADGTYAAPPGGGSGLTVGTTTITSGTSGRILYDNAGVLGEMTTTGTGTVNVLQTSPTLITPTVTTSIVPTTTNTASLGTTSLQWSGLYLSNNQNIDWSNGQATLTSNGGGINIGPAGSTLLLAAGVSTSPPLQFQSAAVTSLINFAGQMEYDGKAFYATSVANARQVVNTEQFISLTSTYTLTSQTAAQKLFNSTTNGTVAVAASTTYQFECVFSLSTLGASNAFGFAFGGTATFTSQGWEALATKTTSLTAASAPLMSWNTAANTAISPSNTSTVGQARIRGFIRINAAGTLIPQVSLGTASAAVVGINSFFRMWPVGTNTVVSVGNWT